MPLDNLSEPTTLATVEPLRKKPRKRLNDINPVPKTELDAAIERVNYLQDELDGYEKDARDVRLELALTVAECRRLYDEAEPKPYRTWTQLCLDRFTKSESYIAELLRIGRSDDPAKAIRVVRERVVERVKKSREKSASVTTPKVTQVDPDRWKSIWTQNGKTVVKVNMLMLRTMGHSDRVKIAKDINDLLWPKSA